MREEAQLRVILTRATPGDQLLNELRVRNDYARFAARARRKQEFLRSLGLEQPVPEDAGVMPAQLLAWYFGRRLGQPMPEDLEAAAREFGFVDRADLHRALLREWLYCRAEQGSDEPGLEPARDARRR
jgi:hypothetical protein